MVSSVLTLDNMALIRSAMVYTRAPASDYDDWEADGWESKNLIPLMKKVLDWILFIFLKLNYSLLSWKHMTYNPIAQPTGTVDLSKCPLVDAN
jgi:hypothetical protein